MPRPRLNRELPQPFLKWAGGKGQLLADLWARVSAALPFGRYHEPFVGGGALFFDLFRRGTLGLMPASLSDNNDRLTETYEAVRDDVDRVINLLKAHRARHDKDYYYAMRARVPEDRTERAARIIYLNRTCFNGLYRENSKGLFNVPMGSYKDPRICDETNLRAVSAALGDADLGQRPFAEVLDRAEPGDLVYFDPPYHPVSETASFTAYHNGGFGKEDQQALAEVFRALDRRRVKVLLSNSWTPFVLDLYDGFTIEEVRATRAVNSRADSRGKVSEALVRNF